MVRMDLGLSVEAAWQVGLEVVEVSEVEEVSTEEMVPKVVRTAEPVKMEGLKAEKDKPEDQVEKWEETATKAVVARVMGAVAKEEESEAVSVGPQAGRLVETTERAAAAKAMGVEAV